MKEVPSNPVFALGALLFLVTHCKAPPEPAPAPSKSAAAAARVSAPAPPAHETPPGCRAIALAGDVEQAGSPLRQGMLVGPSSWVDLRAGSVLTVKHTRSARELALSGPARAKICPKGEEEVVLAEGTLRSSAGVGARPGAEVLIATASGVIHFGDADVEVQARERRTSARARAGDAWVVATFGAARKGPEHINSSGGSSLSARAAATAQEALAACQEAARAAARSAENVLTGSADSGSLGERAASQLRARQTARSICASATAWAGGARDQAESRRIEDAIEEAERQSLVIPQAAPNGRPSP